MDGRTRYAKLKRLADQLPDEELHAEKLKYLIKLHVAATPRIASECMALMLEMGLVKEVKPFRYVKCQTRTI